MGRWIDILRKHLPLLSGGKTQGKNQKVRGCALMATTHLRWPPRPPTNEGLMNSNSDLTCLSISERAQKGWKFWAKDNYAKLISPLNKAYNFVIKDGLYRLTDKIDESFDIRHEAHDEGECKRREWRQAHVNKAKAKRGNVNAGVLVTVMLLALAFNTPGLAAIPFIKQILNASHDN